MIPLLRNPVYNSLRLNDSYLGTSSGRVAYFDEAVSPFAGFEEGYAHGFSDLHQLLPAGRSILYATTETIETPKGWKLSAAIEGLQFLYEGNTLPQPVPLPLTPLTSAHVPQMIELAQLTKPGPFGPRTIAFGHYYGVFEGERLVAMTGQRLHVNEYTEISAVCTHPTCLGKGFATALVQYQLNLIVSHRQIPFLHMRADNHRAIAVYERLGFVQQGPMNFYFLKRV